ncbi:hypothetical protein [Marinobacter orientalis]|uniref:Uncharacterized protein n=1 Tax=Marinobacter orientalis TaxID=1928859 RepID=A0A7Y0RFE4_9GAMM|nr:hypothetical protein [Marinobacter orientalis]NMT65221.1 hypothetical protein [Marinobacter orientalis]TGX48009.1 hypothetical protein DIT72_16500 [Marinobacter orientalis]
MAYILNVLRWYLSLGAKFYRVVPLMTSAIVVLTIVAQIASLLSFFLPLKIIILLGSDGMPRYFPAAFSQLDRDLLIAWLSGTTFGFFLLSLLAEKLIAKATEVAAGELLGKSQKMVLFENQEDVAAKAYQRYSSALAAGVFIPLALFALGWFYPSMAGLIAGYSVFVFVVFMASYRLSERFREYLDQKLTSALGLAAKLGFFLVFAYLVMEFIFFSPPGFIIAIISILASRQIFGRATALVSGLHGLAQQRPRLDGLFFHGKVLVSQQLNPGKKNLWALLQPETRAGWLMRVLEEAGVQPVGTGQLQVQWLDSSKPNMPHLLVYGADMPDQRLLIKVFDVNRKSPAQHEAMLATEGLEGVPIPSLILVTEVDRFACHVYRLPPGQLLKVPQAKRKLPALEKRFVTIHLPPRLVNRYLRSRPLLVDRLSAEVLERLYVACSSRQDTLHVAELINRLAELHLHLKALPLVLMNPNMVRSVWQADADQSLLALNWDKWSLDPLGAGWPLPGKPFARLVEHLAGEPDRRLNTADSRKVRLSALAYGLEDFNNRQLFNDALDVLPEILDMLNALQDNAIEE